MKQIKHNTATFRYTDIAVLNVFLAAAAVFLLIYYVIISNVITASNYRIGLLNEELSNLTGINGILTAQKLSVEDSSTVRNFAESHYMVEARHIIHIFESGDVALQR